MIALLPGGGRRRLTRAGETRRANRLAAELKKAETFIGEANRVNFMLIGELEAARSQTDHYRHVAEELAGDLARAERCIRDLEEERRAEAARRAEEDTITIPAPRDIQARDGQALAASVLPLAKVPPALLQ